MENMIKYGFLRGLWIFLFTVPLTLYSQKVIHINTNERSQYQLELIKLALSKSGQSYQFEITDYKIAQGRWLRDLQTGNGIPIDVAWAFTTPDREKDLLPIKIPIERGLFGWRVFFIHATDSVLFRKNFSEDHIKSLRAVQAPDWPDFTILKENGFNVLPALHYESMFALPKNNRVDYFPRSVHEILREQERFQEANELIIEPNWLLHYPANYYFFVNKNRPDLAFDIEKGLKISIEDGSMKELFLRYFEKNLILTNLSNRRIIHLVNPFFDESIYKKNPEYWFDPEKGF